MVFNYRIATILFFALLKLSATCDIDDVAVYNVKLQMLWSEDRFPKDYPQNRPKAQWSKVFGQSHNASYALYRVNEVARNSIRDFAQFGKVDTLVVEGDDEPKVYDQFSASALGQGAGETENVVFVDGSHTLISFVCRMIPSPDWFIGLDSLNLCVDSTWVDQVTLDLEPLDAGAASGLSFTSPRWETNPPEPVVRHQPRVPNHPAAGFYYPELKELPPIAKVEITKIKQYTTKELNDLIRMDLVNKLKTKDKRNRVPKHIMIKELTGLLVKEVSTKSHLDQLKDLEEEPFGTPQPNIPENYVEVITKPTKIATTEKEFDGELDNMDDVILAVAHGRKLGLHKHLPRHFRSRLHHAVNKIQLNDCLVSEWSEWTSCSKTCGFGEKFRYRSVIRMRKEGGRDCPSLTDRKHCDNISSCAPIDYFEW